MKKVFLCAILASLSYPAIASSLQDQLSAVAEAEQQGKNEEQRQHDEWVAERNREIQQEKQRRANAQAAANKRAATAAANKKARQDKLDAEATADKKRDQSYEDERVEFYSKICNCRKKETVKGTRRTDCQGEGRRKTKKKKYPKSESCDQSYIMGV